MLRRGWDIQYLAGKGHHIGATPFSHNLDTDSNVKLLESLKSSLNQCNHLILESFLRAQAQTIFEGHECCHAS